jgi:hypothetical protein
VVRRGDGRQIEPRVIQLVFEERLDAQQQDAPPGLRADGGLARQLLGERRCEHVQDRVRQRDAAGQVPRIQPPAQPSQERRHQRPQPLPPGHPDACQLRQPRRGQLQQLAREHHHQHPVRVVDLQLVRAGGVVDGEVTRCQRRLAPVLRQHAAAPHLHPHLEVIRGAAPDQLPGTPCPAAGRGDVDQLDGTQAGRLDPAAERRNVVGGHRHRHALFPYSMLERLEPLRARGAARGDQLRHDPHPH